MVDRKVAEVSIRDTRRPRIPSQWRRCPRRPLVDAFTKSEAEIYELDGLQAWVEGRDQRSISTLLWMIKTSKLAKQKQYVEELAPGGSEGEAWKTRYATVPQFMGDLALSVDITTDALKRLKSELLSSRQRAEEKTGAFYTRVTTQTATVNFVAEVVRGCRKVTKLELLELFWGGLRHSIQVGSKLVDIRLDTSHPEQWEDEQRRLVRSDTSLS
ncbi:hypothetical protein CYMTET_4985 [Cymbomonas tetramitiformis]|uniref:Uncharacterized protein n=1 Tax=Cymbomonas tetramitiformis TaxID=36881 RepID=A0AAE0H1Y6_9CHLO|nr:hypothetical protein CYMTET_4985 [Cymbomonas tetramitiformis]